MLMREYPDQLKNTQEVNECGYTTALQQHCIIVSNAYQKPSLYAKQKLQVLLPAAFASCLV